MFCSECGTRLIEDSTTPSFNIGDGNAISGGVNINNSKSFTSHSIHHHTTINERAKSDSEIRLDATNQLREAAESIMATRGRIDSTALSELRSIALKSGINDDTFKNIIKDIRSSSRGSSSSLNAVNARYIEQARQAIESNDTNTLINLLPRLDAIAEISQDDNVQYIYYAALALFNTAKCIELYENKSDDNYWRTFWAAVSYIKANKYAQASNILTLFEPAKYDKPTEDQNILEAYFNMMRDDRDETQNFLDDILGEPSEHIKPILNVIEAFAYEEEPDSPVVSFYATHIKTKVTIKSTSANDVKEIATNDYIATDSTEANAIYMQACTKKGEVRVMLLQKAADRGSVDAMFDLGNCYSDGEGVNENLELGIKHIKQAADNGHTLAQFGIGMMYYCGEDGMEQNFTMAEKYLLMAAKSGNVEAQLTLAYLYRGLDDYNQALYWARKAAQTDNADSHEFIGMAYLNGMGVKQDTEEGIKWLESAAEYGSASAQFTLGDILMGNDYGANVEVDPERSFKYLMMAAQQEHAEAMFCVGLCYSSGKGTPKDNDASMEWIRKAAEMGFEPAIEFLKGDDCGNEEQQMQQPQHSNEAYALYQQAQNEFGAKKVMLLQKALNGGCTDALVDLSSCYRYGEGTTKNIELANSYMQQALDLGDPRAQTDYGYGHFSPNPGEPQNYAEAEKYFLLAANQGYTEAQVYLAQLYKEVEDYDNAFHWANIAIQAPNVEEYYSCGRGETHALLAKCYIIGRGTAQNVQLGMRYLQNAIDMYNHEALLFAADIYFDNQYGIRQDKNLAFKYYKEIAEPWHNPEAMFKLGICYYYGEGTKQDTNTGMEWIRKAADKEYLDAELFIKEVNNAPTASINNIAETQTQTQTQTFEITDVKVSTNGHKEIYFDIEWQGPKDSNLKLEMRVHDNKNLFDKHFCPPNKLRLTLNNSYQLGLVHDYVNKVTFYVELGDVNYNENRFTRVATSGPIVVSLYHYFNFFSNSKLEIRGVKRYEQ